MISFKLGEAVCNLALLQVGGVTLTPQEADLLSLFVKRALQPIERMEFYREIWGYRSMPQGRALDFAVRRLRQRLEREGAPQGVIETVRGVGFRLAVLPVEHDPELTKSVSETNQSPDVVVPPRARLGTVLPRDGFVGRDLQLVALRESLERGSFVTLVGPPGVGKSRLALEVLRGTIGSTLVLKGQGLTTMEDLLGCFQEALQQPTADSALDVARWLLDAGVDHVLLENADTLGSDAREGLDFLHAHGSGLTLLVTRRGPLHLGAERVVAVEPLSIQEASELFCERANRLGISVEVNEDLRELVSQLDGLPLAIELAATRARVLSVADLKKSLDQRFRLLRKRSRGATERHDSLEVVLTEAFSALSPAESEALLRLSLCQSRFSEELAQELLCDLDELHIDLLEGLVDNGLLQSSSEKEMPFMVLGSVSSLAVKQADSTRLGRAKQVYLQCISERVRASKHVALEDLLSASSSEEPLELAYRCAFHAAVRCRRLGRMEVGRGLLERWLARDDLTSTMQVALLRETGWWHYRLEEFSELYAVAEAAGSAAEQSGDSVMLGMTWIDRAIAVGQFGRGDLSAAERCIEEARAILTDSGALMRIRATWAELNLLARPEDAFLAYMEVAESATGEIGMSGIFGVVELLAKEDKWPEVRRWLDRGWELLEPMDSSAHEYQLQLGELRWLLGDGDLEEAVALSKHLIGNAAGMSDPVQRAWCRILALRAYIQVGDAEAVADTVAWLKVRRTLPSSVQNEIDAALSRQQ